MATFVCGPAGPRIGLRSSREGFGEEKEEGICSYVRVRACVCPSVLFGRTLMPARHRHGYGRLASACCVLRTYLPVSSSLVSISSPSAQLRMQAWLGLGCKDEGWERHADIMCRIHVRCLYASKRR